MEKYSKLYIHDPTRIVLNYKTPYDSRLSRLRKLVLGAYSQSVHLNPLSQLKCLTVSLTFQIRDRCAATFAIVSHGLRMGMLSMRNAKRLRGSGLTSSVGCFGPSLKRARAGLLGRGGSMGQPVTSPRVILDSTLLNNGVRKFYRMALSSSHCFKARIRDFVQ